MDLRKAARRPLIKCLKRIIGGKGYIPPSSQSCLKLALKVDSNKLHIDALVAHPQLIQLVVLLVILFAYSEQSESR